MSEKQTDDLKEKTIGGTEILNLHLSDIFKDKKKLTRKNLINKIIIGAKQLAGPKKMVKIQLNGSWCKYFIINKGTFKKNDISKYGTLDEKGLFVFSTDQTVEPIAQEENEENEQKEKEQKQDEKDQVLVFVNSE